MTASHPSTKEVTDTLQSDLATFGVAFLMMTPDGQMKRIPPEAVSIDIDKMNRAAADE